MAKVTLMLEDTPDGGVLIISESSNDGLGSEEPFTYAELLLFKVLDQFQEWFPGMEVLSKRKPNAAA